MKKSLILLCISIALLCFISCSDTYKTDTGILKVEFLDAGQADCTLITLPDGRFILVDTATPDFKRELDKILKTKGVRDFAMVIFTHPHSDHIGNADDIVKKYGIEHLVMPDVSYQSTEYKNLSQAISDREIDVINPSPNDVYEFGGVKITFLAPVNDSYEDLNDHSVVFKLTYGESDFLFCGDISFVSEYEMLEMGLDVSCDVIKVAHHGSDISSSPAFLEKAMPGYAVITCENGNSSSLPESAVLNRLQSIGAEILKTCDGTVKITSDSKTIRVE